MKIICTQENFRKAIINSERMVSRQNTLPILNNILFETEMGGLKLSATNLEIGVVVKIGARIEKEGKATIPARLLSNFITNLQQGEEDNVFLESIDQGMRIKSGNTKAIIKGLSANEFPLIPAKKAEFLLKIPGNALKNSISQIINCVAINETRQELTGINLSFFETELFFAATDSFRLAEKKLKLKDEFINKDIYSNFINKKNNIIIPANTLIELMRIISYNETSEVEITIEENQIFFELDGITIISRLINGKYPEYKHIIPKDFKTKGVVKKEALQSAVKMASIFSLGKSGEITLKINPEQKKVFIEAKSVEVGENTTSLEVDITGPQQEIVFNSKYLLDGVGTVSTTNVAILSNSNNTPVALKEIEEKSGKVLDGYTYIVMPIKL